MWGLALSLLKGKGLPWALAGLVTVGGLGSYYLIIKPKIEKAAVTELLAEQRKKELEEVAKRLAEISSAKSTLEASIREIEQENDRFLLIFREHDFTELSYAKPSLIESRVNKATENLYKELEEITDETRN